MPKIQLVEPVGVLSSPTIDHWNHPHTGGEHNHHQFYELIQQWNRHVLIAMTRSYQSKVQMKII